MIKPETLAALVGPGDTFNCNEYAAEMLAEFLRDCSFTVWEDETVLILPLVGGGVGIGLRSITDDDTIRVVADMRSDTESVCEGVLVATGSLTAGMPELRPSEIYRILCDWHAVQGGGAK